MVDGTVRVGWQAGQWGEPVGWRSGGGWTWTRRVPAAAGRAQVGGAAGSRAGRAGRCPHTCTGLTGARAGRCRTDRPAGRSCPRSSCSTRGPCRCGTRRPASGSCVKAEGRRGGGSGPRVRPAACTLSAGRHCTPLGRGRSLAAPKLRGTHVGGVQTPSVQVEAWLQQASSSPHLSVGSLSGAHLLAVAGGLGGWMWAGSGGPHETGRPAAWSREDKEWAALTWEGRGTCPGSTSRRPPPGYSSPRGRRPR